jgi:DNA-binding transcriptional ArsR family regulator
MQEEPRLLLQDFITDSHNYVSILRAISGGAVTNNRISTRTGLSKGHISKYLSVLRDTGFVEREVPVTEDPARSRRGRYHVTDPYMRFHYRFLSAYQAQLALGEQQQMLTYISANLPDFIENSTWIELCREWLVRAGGYDLIPLSIEQVGGAWVRNDTIGVVGIDKRRRHLVMGSCHWQQEPATLADFEALVEKTPAILPNKSKEKWRVYYLGFGSAGWTQAAQESAESRAEQIAGNDWVSVGVRLIDLEKLDADLIEWTNAALAS